MIWADPARAWWNVRAFRSWSRLPVPAPWVRSFASRPLAWLATDATGTTSSTSAPAIEAGVKLPVLRQSPIGSRIEWRAPAYHTVAQVLKHPRYAGAYVFGRTTPRTQIIDGRARKSLGRHKPLGDGNVLIREHHPPLMPWGGVGFSSLACSPQCPPARPLARQQKPKKRPLQKKASLRVFF